MMAPAVFAMLLLAVAVSQLTCKLLDPANFAVVLSAVAMQRHVDCVPVPAADITPVSALCYLLQSSHAAVLSAASCQSFHMPCSWGICHHSLHSQVLCIYDSCRISTMTLLSDVAVYLVMETLYKRFSHGKFTYASLPVLHSPEAVQPSTKLDAAMLNQHDIDSQDDSTHEHTDTGQHSRVQQLHYELSALAVTC